MNTKKKAGQKIENTVLPHSNGNLGSQTQTAEKTKHQTDPERKVLLSYNLLEDELDSRELLAVLAEVRNGNFSARLPIDRTGISGKICDTLNDIISLNETLVQELDVAKKTIGKQGKLTHRVELPRSARGSWNSAVESINTLISDLVHPTIEIAHVIS